MKRLLTLTLFIGFAWGQEEDIQYWSEKGLIKLIQIETTVSTIEYPIVTSILDSTITLLRGETIPISSLNSITTYGKVNPILPLLGFFPCGITVGSWVGFMTALFSYSDPFGSGTILIITTLSGGVYGYKKTKDYFRYKNKKYELIKNWSIDKKRTFIKSHIKQEFGF